RYVAHINLAHQALADGNRSEAESLLRLQAPEENAADFRGFEWHYLQRQKQSRPVTFRAEKAGTPVVRFTPDSGRVILDKLIPDGDKVELVVHWPEPNGYQRRSPLSFGVVGSLRDGPLEPSRFSRTFWEGRGHLSPSGYLFVRSTGSTTSEVSSASGSGYKV